MLGKSSGLPSCVVEAARCCDPRSPCVSIRERVAPSRVSTILLAHRGSVNPLLILNTLVGGMLAAGGANTLNCVADADIDKKMKRTAQRPLARAAVPTGHALVFGVALSVASFAWLWWTTNLLSGLLAGGTN